MEVKNPYIKRVIEQVKKRDPNELLFHQTVEEVYSSLEPVIEKRPELEKYAILERIAEPDRTIIFRVAWVDEAGVTNVNRGMRVQNCGAIGPYKGGFRFDPTVSLEVCKFLGFEQTFKNSLTSLAMGGAKGGADFDPRGRSDADIMRFCQAFMTECYRYLGPDVDVPAGDIGVAAREVGFMYGQYKRIRGAFENGTFTGKGPSYGGSILRPEATGFGATYYTDYMLTALGDKLAGKTVMVSGFGNVAWGTCIKMTEMGAKVVTISGPDGWVHDPDGVATAEKHDFLVEMLRVDRGRVAQYADKYPNATFHAGEKPWGKIPVDIAMPCATQNEITIDEAKVLLSSGVKYLIEVSNMPCTNDAITFCQANGIQVAPSKAVNAGGVSTSGLEMTQNSIRLSWKAEEVDEKLRDIMKNIHDASLAAALGYGFGHNLVAGANIAGFLKLADALLAQGVY